ncbi:MAG: EF-hand domain-containing protein [Desulfobacula sp.]|nr:EF-hand domain-containing protein [Desulfobacula sp.]
MNIQGIGQSYSAYYTSSYSSSGMRGTQGGGFTPPAPPDAATIIETEDTNEDGVLSIEETRLTEEMFADADTDSDGMLTLEELEEMLANGPPAAGGGMSGMGGGMGGGGAMGPEPMSIESIFETEDADGDDLISAEESALSDEIFSEIDTDQDGYLTAEEIEAGRENKKEPTELTQTLASSTTVTQDMAIKAYQQAIQSFLLNYSGESTSSGSLASVLNAVA